MTKSNVMNLFRKFLFCFSVSTLTIQIVSAQTPEVQTVDFRTLGLTRGVSSDLFFQTAEGYEPLPLRYFRPSSNMTAILAENGSLPIFTKEETLENGIQYVFHGQVAVPGGSGRVLLLGGQSNGRISFNAVSDNLSENDRDWLYINTTNTPIAVQLGEGNSPIGVAPGESIFHRTNVESGKGAAVRVAVFREEGWDRIYSRFWPIYEGQRSMVIFMDYGDQIKVHNFFEAVERPGD